MASFRKREDNTWEYRIRYKDIYTGKYKEKSKRGFKRKADAQEEASKVELDLNDGVINQNDNPTFESYMNRWLSSVKGNYAAGSYFNKQRSIERISREIGNVPLKMINFEIVSRYLQTLADKDYSRAIISGDLVTIRKTISMARKSRYFHNNPLDGVSMPKTKLPRQPRFWSTDDLTKFIDMQTLRIEHKNLKATRKEYLTSVRDLALICTLAGSGARVGELCALDLDNFDTMNNVLELHHNFVPSTENRHADKYIRTDIMKTSSSRREVPVPSLVADNLKSWLQVRSKFLALNHIDDSTQALFVSTQSGLNITPATVRSVLTAVTERFGLKKINVHGFRHTYASFLLQAGVPAKQAQALLGHKDIKTTLNVYTHVSQNDKREAVDLLENLLTPPKKENLN